MNIAVFGALGRVGKRIVALAMEHNVWQIDKSFEANPLERVDVAIDFSLASATDTVCEFCKKYRCPLVTGVTGRNKAQQSQIEQLQKCVRVVAKDNFCQGVQLLQEIAQIVAQKTNWQCEIVETHHALKKDCPSGTAKMLATTLSKQRAFCPITVHSLRLGSNFGKHQIIFATNGQSLTITHQAENVDIFAQGALNQAIELANKTDC